MAYVVDKEKLDDAGKKFRDYVNNEVADKINDLATLFDEVEWQGSGHDEFVKIYKEQLAPFYEAKTMLENLGFYMQFVAEKYNEVDVESQEEFKKFKAEIEHKELKPEDVQY